MHKSCAGCVRCNIRLLKDLDWTRIWKMIWTTIWTMIWTTIWKGFGSRGTYTSRFQEPCLAFIMLGYMGHLALMPGCLPPSVSGRQSTYVPRLMFMRAHAASANLLLPACYLPSVGRCPISGALSTLGNSTAAPCSTAMLARSFAATGSN
jgi:hypothetical protein